jgi:hypothetical protein
MAVMSETIPPISNVMTPAATYLSSTGCIQSVSVFLEADAWRWLTLGGPLHARGRDTSPENQRIKSASECS